MGTHKNKQKRSIEQIIIFDLAALACTENIFNLYEQLKMSYKSEKKIKERPVLNLTIRAAMGGPGSLRQNRKLCKCVW